MKILVAVVLLACAAAARAATPFPTNAVLLMGRLDTNTINESSGVIPSHRASGAYWTHNDGDNSIFAFTRAGQSLGKWNIGGRELHDFEDIAWSPGRIYIADIGNNFLTRTNVSVYAVPEPGPTFSGSLPLKGQWRLTYPNAQAFDAESFFIHRRYGYIVTKEVVNGAAGVYRFPLRRFRSELEPRCQLNVGARISGADMTRDGTRLAVITDDGPYLFLLPGVVPASGILAPALFVPFVFEGMEGCCFTRDGLLVTSETGEVFLFTHDLFRVRRL